MRREIKERQEAVPKFAILLIFLNCLKQHKSRFFLFPVTFLYIIILLLLLLYIFYFALYQNEYIHSRHYFSTFFLSFPAKQPYINPSDIFSFSLCVFHINQCHSRWSYTCDHYTQPHTSTQAQTHNGEIRKMENFSFPFPFIFHSVLCMRQTRRTHKSSQKRVSESIIDHFCHNFFACFCVCFVQTTNQHPHFLFTEKSKLNLKQTRALDFSHQKYERGGGKRDD